MGGARISHPIWWPSSPPHPTGPNQLVLFEERPSLNPALPIPRGKMVRAEFLLEMWEQSQEDFLEEGEVTSESPMSGGLSLS